MDRLNRLNLHTKVAVLLLPLKLTPKGNAYIGLVQWSWKYNQKARVKYIRVQS